MTGRRLHARQVVPALVGLLGALALTAVGSHQALSPLSGDELAAASCAGASGHVSYETTGYGDTRVLDAVVLAGLPAGCVPADVRVRVATSSGEVVLLAAAPAGTGALRASVPGPLPYAQVRGVSWRVGPA